MSDNIIEFQNAPYIPPDVRKHIEENGYKVKCAQGFYWYVYGYEDGEPFELGLKLFITLARMKMAEAE